MNKTKKKRNTLPKRTKILCCAIAFLMLATIVLAVVGSCQKRRAFNTFTFTEYVADKSKNIDTITNPGVGYSTTVWYNAAPNNTPILDKQGALVLFFIDLGAFSAGVNGTKDSGGNYTEGTDYDLDETFFNALRATFSNCRNNGSTIAVRFRYDANGKDNPEPKTFEQVLRHISQIKESGILQDYADILMFVESGFVGKWGEQHGGKYTSLEYKAQLLSAMLKCVPAPVPVTVRTPDIFAKYVGISRDKLADYVCKEGTDEYRVGLYDDGYMGSNSDLGTYANRDIETTWLGKQTLTSYFGGEYSGNIEFAKQYDTYKPENCIPEMYKTHVSYINGNIFKLYEDYTFNKKLDVKGYDNSAYYGKSVWQFIRDHLGYRFVLKNSKISKTVAQGETLDVTFTLVNNGFANLIKKQKCEIVLEKDGNFVCCQVDSDPTKWLSGKTVTEQLQIKLPAFLEAGKWNVYFKSSIGNADVSQFAMRSVRFANINTWNESLGANYLGSFSLQNSNNAKTATDNTICEVGSKPRQAQLYNMGQKVQVDGKLTSNYEWQDSDAVVEQDGKKLYVKADEQNLYVAATLPHNSAAPVFNLRVTKPAPTSDNPNATKTYWLYQQSGGFVYFSDPDHVGHAGMQLKYSNGMFEFQIPLFMFGLKDGDVLQSVNVFVQDSANDWKSTGKLESSAPVTVHSDFVVYNATEHLKVKLGDSLSFTLFADADVESVVWLLNGETLLETSRTLTLNRIAKSAAGEYTAQITTTLGSVKTVTVAVVEVV